MTEARTFILASASPRRAEILAGLGISHRVVPAHVEERRREGESPEGYVERLAREKAASVQALHPGAWVLAGDTTVALGDQVLEKPRDGDHALAMLMELSGREHRVATALALAVPGGGTPLSGVEVTRVRFRAFDAATARGYVATGEPMDKAGAYGIQGMGATLVEGIEGDFSGVVGLSVPLLMGLLEQAGAPFRFPAANEMEGAGGQGGDSVAATPRGAEGSPPSSGRREGATYAHILARELSAAKREVLAYPDDEAPWLLLPGWPNSGGTLAHHMAGNVRHFVGAAVGGEGFQRDREGEFGDRGLSREALARELDEALAAVNRVLPRLPDPAFDAPVHFPPWGKPGWEGLGGTPTLRGFLLHLLSHASYHLGQLDYHRRGVTGQGEGVGAVDLGDLPRG